MPLLAYCLIEEASAVEKPALGVGGTAIEEVLESGLRCYYSRFAGREQIAEMPAVEAALAFHAVIQAVFRQAALVPFRFPTVVQDEEQLLKYLRENGTQYRESLGRLRGMAQMEVRIGAGRDATAPPSSGSGREYLAARQARAAALAEAAHKFRQATQAWAVAWREHPLRDGLRCFALVPREAVERFRQAAEAVQERPADSRVSGPWPATEFLDPVKDFQ